MIEATNGCSGLEIALSVPLDLLLLDINLPDMNGLEVLQRLQNNTKTEKLNIIALTANTMDGDRRYYLKAGFDAYLAKPFTRLELTNVLRNYLFELIGSNNFDTWRT
jgi:CheY-like chemotaxis protein